jgi:polyadenylate-binding protein
MPQTTIYVSNISYSAVPKDLGAAFESFGKVKRATILTEFFRGQRVSRGIGFVEFETEEAANAAIEQTGKVSINNRQLRIQKARPKQPQVTAHIKGIPKGTTKEMVLDVFKPHNAVDAKIVFENTEGENPRLGFGFVKFAEENDLRECLKAHREVELNGGVTKVHFARRSFDAKPRRRFNRFRRAAQ